MKYLFLMVSLITFNVQALELKDDVDRFLKCMVKVNESHRVTLDSSIKLYHLFTDLKQGLASESLEQCLEIKKESNSLPRLSKKEIENLKKELSFLENDPHDKFFNYFKNTFIDYISWCKMGGFNANIAIGVMIGGGMSVGKCSTTNRQNFLVVAPKIEVGQGFGGFIYIEKFDEPGYDSLPENTEYYVGFGVAVSIESGDPSLSPKLGAGLGLTSSKTFRFPIKLIPIGFDFSHDRTRLGI